MLKNSGMKLVCSNTAYNFIVCVYIYIYIKNPAFLYALFKKKSELLNQLRSFTNQFVRYIHGKVCSLSSV